MNLSERLHTVIAETGIDQVELGRVMGVTKGAVNQLLNGSIQSLKLEYALGAQERFGYNAVWLVLGKGPKKGSASPGADTNSGNRGVKQALSHEADSLIQRIMHVDRHGNPARETFAYMLGILEIVERLNLKDDSDVVDELEEQEKLLSHHEEPSRARKHASRKHE